MTVVSKRFERLLKAARSWPLEAQEAAADVLEQFDRLAQSRYRLSDEVRADLDAALDEVRKGEFASEAEVVAVFTRHGL